MQKIFKFFVFSITILIINLLTTYITDYFMAYKGTTNPLRFTAIGMGVLVVCFYPLFTYLDDQVQKLAAKILKKGNNLFGRTIGIIIAYAAVLFVLFCFYAHLWFKIDMVRYLINQL